MFHCFSLSECYFAGKGTALMLGSNERLVRPNNCATTTNHLITTSENFTTSPPHRSISNMSQTSDLTAISTTSTTDSTLNQLAAGNDHNENDEKSSQNQSSNGGNDIQKHLQSMFYLLRPEETLKMVRKIISLFKSLTLCSMMHAFYLW